MCKDRLHFYPFLFGEEKTRVCQRAHITNGVTEITFRIIDKIGDYGLSFQFCHSVPTVEDGVTVGVWDLLVTADLRPTSRMTY